MVLSNLFPLLLRLLFLTFLSHLPDFNPVLRVTSVLAVPPKELNQVVKICIDEKTNDWIEGHVETLVVLLVCMFRPHQVLLVLHAQCHCSVNLLPQPAGPALGSKY